MSLLIATTDDEHALAEGRVLANALVARGMLVPGVVPCHMLVREVVRLAPLGVVLRVAGLDAALRSALALLADTAPRPVLVLGAAGAPDDAITLVDQHVVAWMVGQLDAATVMAAWPLAQAAFAQRQQLQAALAAAQARLDERKWVDRAKGVLMQHQQLSEDDAFSLLRTASMQANLRVGEVSRSLIEAAQAADAVNRSGQLRMLSQRFVKSLVLRGLPRPRPDDQLDETAQRLQSNLDHLAQLARLGGLAASEPMRSLLADTRAAWLALQAASADAGRSAGARATAEVLLRVESLAEALLLKADALTEALQSASGRRNLAVVNLCGRQRMLSQRLAKQALLAGVLPEADAARHAADAARTVQDFETALAALEQAPLATEAIRAALAQARGQWQRLLEGLRRAAGGIDTSAGRSTLARESEALLASFERLTSLYEHSMQVLLG